MKWQFNVPMGTTSISLNAEIICNSHQMEQIKVTGKNVNITILGNRPLIEAIERLSHFYMHESCGQCTPCREGTGWLWRIVSRIEHGEGRPEDLDLLNDVAANIQGRTI